jgi:hypothetical protein
MAIITDEQRADLETLRALIACSPIIVRRRKATPRPYLQGPCLYGSSLPAGFDEVDAAILEWIAAEGRRVSRRLVRM